MEYQYTDDMAEISGFGGGYEEGCRKMVVAGLKWFDEHPDADPKFHGYEGIYGVISEDNEDAKQLTEVMVAAPGEHGCTGAMHQATVGHVLHIRAVGWDKYVEEMREGDKEQVKECTS